MNIQKLIEDVVKSDNLNVLTWYYKNGEAFSELFENNSFLDNEIKTTLDKKYTITNIDSEIIYSYDESYFEWSNEPYFVEPKERIVHYTTIVYEKII